MAIREFRDSKGVTWRVWMTAPGSSLASPELRNGWLTFDSDGERRRLGPVPKGWEDLPADRLEHLCQLAVPGRPS